ncbi:hypothetical protein T10_1889 [Trichinella papuae]|uniref:Uncharacterized protein n=1 Tax=Trichinella papuae TaxID=268474 RepID=A0A0V1M1D0_9BILA|nr:hypothetical protein T10_1889 [Trichinella papuae]
MPSKKRKRGRMVNRDYSDQEDIPEAEAYPPALDVSSEHGNEVSVGYVRNFLRLYCVSPSEWAMVGRYLLWESFQVMLYPPCTSISSDFSQNFVNGFCGPTMMEI